MARACASKQCRHASDWSSGADWSCSALFTLLTNRQPLFFNHFCKSEKNDSNWVKVTQYLERLQSGNMMYGTLGISFSFNNLNHFFRKIAARWVCMYWTNSKYVLCVCSVLCSKTLQCQFRKRIHLLIMSQ